jgi:radical SAM-linked protein
MNRERVRIRFRKEGDLRLISHRDLARTLERLFRRAELPLAMSEGFHPHPRITFASALALGIEGADEVVDVVLERPVDVELVRRRFDEQSPPGLVITDAKILDDQEPKPQVDRVSYEIRVPASRHEALRQAIGDLLRQSSYRLDRAGRREPIDLRPAIDDLRLEGHFLRMQLRVTSQAMPHPREILQVLGQDDLESQGAWLVRREVHLIRGGRRRQER